MSIQFHYEVKDFSDRFKVEEYLNKMGDQGWEVVSVWSTPECWHVVMKQKGSKWQ